MVFPLKATFRRAGRAPESPAPELVAWEGLVADGHVTVGPGTYFAGVPQVHRYQGSEAPVHIGSYCSIANDVEFLTGGDHPSGWVSTFPFRCVYDLPGAYTDGMPATKGPIVVGNDVFLGRGCKILHGVTIGHGAVVGAWSVVARDVRPYAIVTGAPAVERRRRFTEEQVEAMLAIGWWDWPQDELIQHVDALQCPDIEAFIEQFGPGAR